MIDLCISVIAGNKSQSYILCAGVCWCSYLNWQQLVYFVALEHFLSCCCRVGLDLFCFIGDIMFRFQCPVGHGYEYSMWIYFSLIYSGLTWWTYYLKVFKIKRKKRNKNVKKEADFLKSFTQDLAFPCIYKHFSTLYMGYNETSCVLWWSCLNS